MLPWAWAFKFQLRPSSWTWNLTRNLNFKLKFQVPQALYRPLTSTSVFWWPEHVRVFWTDLSSACTGTALPIITVSLVSRLLFPTHRLLIPESSNTKTWRISVALALPIALPIITVSSSIYLHLNATFVPHSSTTKSGAQSTSWTLSSASTADYCPVSFLNVSGIIRCLTVALFFRILILWSWPPFCNDSLKMPRNYGNNFYTLKTRHLSYNTRKWVWNCCKYNCVWWFRSGPWVSTYILVVCSTIHL